MTILRFFIFLFVISNSYSAKIKDLVSIKGVRENPLIGYGLVIGLNGTGDKGGSITNASLARMFKNLGLNPQQEAASNNVAAVVVTAKLPSFSRLGQKIDVTVSSVANASSLAGGTLLITPLKEGMLVFMLLLPVLFQLEDLLRGVSTLRQRSFQMVELLKKKLHSILTIKSQFA